VNIEKLEIPPDWSWSTMGDIADVIGGGTPKTKDPTNFEDGEIPWLTPADLSGYSEKIIGKGARSITQKGLESSSAKLMPAGTVLFTSRAPIGYVAIASNEISTNQGFKSFVLKSSDILPDYVYWWLKGNKDLAESYASGTTFLELSGAKAKQLPIPIAPLEQQKRIVAEIEKQFSRLDEAVANLKRVKANLKRYKAAVLKAAVEGKLTEEWRKQHPDVEPASKLLKRILAERRQKWEEAELAKMKAKGKVPKDDKWKRKYREPPKVDASNLPDLPTGWVWTNFEQLAEDIPNALKAGPFGSALKKSFYVPKGYKIYGQEQVIRDDPSYGDYYINEARYKQLESCAVKSGDMLVSLVGTIGRILVLPEDIEPGIINPRLVKMSLDFRLVDPIFIRAYLQSPYVKYLFAIASHGGTMDILNMTILKGIPIPLPPSEEQKMILDEFERVATIEAELEKTSSTNLLRAERLRQSILSKAFSGELTVEDEKGMENKCQTCQ